MNLKIYQLFLFVLIICSCKQEKQHLNKIEGKLLPVTDSLQINKDIDAFIKPYRESLNKDMDSVLAYSVDNYSKSDGELNTAIGNFMADAVYEQANPVFKNRTGNDIDAVMLNHGGIRADISKGNINTRTAYEIMPFENSIIVVAVKGNNIFEMCNYLRKSKRAHPISKLKLTIDSKDNIKEALIKGKEIDTLKTYYLATNDYLYNGGDGMRFFKPNDTVYVLDYKIRNALLDYFKKTDTISPVIDDRFTQIK